MPKMKTRRAVAKRFKATASGKLKRKRANLRHILEKKSQKCKIKSSLILFFIIISFFFFIKTIR